MEVGGWGLEGVSPRLGGGSRAVLRVGETVFRIEEDAFQPGNKCSLYKIFNENKR